MRGRPVLKKTFVTALKTLTTILIFWLIANELDLTATINILEKSNQLGLVSCLLLAVPLLVLDGSRWQAVMRAMGHQIRLQTALLYMLVGMFFINLMPAFVGFDAFRAAQMRRFGVPTDIAISSVLIDRLCAFAALPLIIALGMPHALTLAEVPADQSVLLLVLLFSFAGLGAAMLSGPFYQHLPKWTVLRPLSPIARLSTQLWQTLTSGIQRTRILAASALVHVMRVVIVFALAKTLGITVSFIDCFSLVPISLLIAMIPVSLASWGVREAAFIYVFGFAGVTSEDAFVLSVLFGAFRLAVGAIGGIVWLVSTNNMYALEIKPKSEGPTSMDLR